jgi:uncharacterized protein
MRELLDGTRPSNAAPSLRDLRSRAAEVQNICARNGASNVWVFGSVARGDGDADSDLDLVVDIEKGRSLFDLAGLVLELEDLLGCPVNVIQHATLSDDAFSDAVRRDMVPL